MRSREIGASFWVLTLTISWLAGCGHDVAGPIQPPFTDEIYQRFQAYQLQLAPRNGLRHGVLVTEHLTGWHVVAIAGPSRVELTGLAPDAHACWIARDLPGILYDDGPAGAVIRALPTDGHPANTPTEMVRVDGVVHTPMVSRDGRVFAFVVQETGHDTSFVEIHDGVSVRRFPLLAHSWASEVSMADRGEAIFYTVPYEGLYGLWLDAGEPSRVLYAGDHRAALAADEGRLVYSQNHGTFITLNEAQLDDAHRVVFSRWIADCRTCEFYDAAMGPTGEVYCIRNADGTGRLYDQTTGQILTTGAAEYSWPSVQ